VLKGIFKVGNAQVKVRWVNGEKELSVISINVVVEGKREDESTEWGGVHDK